MTLESVAYEKHKNLKLAASEIGIKWQTLYCRLRKQGIQVCGDKTRYGTPKDQLATFAESGFKRLVPDAINMNSVEWQSKYDFSVNGYKIDIKSATQKRGLKRSNSMRWAFSIKKQSVICDFICCFCMNEKREIEKILLIPRELFEGMQTISVATSGNSKWKGLS